MDKTTQDLAWSVLPKGFKEEVKELYDSIIKMMDIRPSATQVYANKLTTLEHLFGIHNLTSDAEGDDDEMLCVSRKDMQFYYQYYKTKRESESSAEQKAYYKGRTKVLLDLFGSKCLPDEKPTTQFKIGDKVRVKGIKQIGTIKEPYSNDIGYRVYFEDGDGGWDKEYQEDELIPYNELQTAEPKFKVCDTAYYVCSPTLKHKCTITNVMQNEHSGKWEYNVMFEWGKPGMWIPESDLEPCTSQDPIPPKSGELKPQTAETQSSPQFNIGDKVKIIGGYYGFIGHIGEVIKINGNDINVELPGFGISTYDAEDLAPYADDDLIPPDQFRDPAKMTDDIIKDGFADHNRLNIAAMLAAGMLANEGVTCFTDVQELEHMDFITYHAFEYADKLIKKSKEDEEQ